MGHGVQDNKSTVKDIRNNIHAIGWNIVTSFLQSAADSFGLEQQVEHDERYRMADEFMDVVYKLLEASWDNDAVERNKKTGVYSNPEKVCLTGSQFSRVVPSLILSSCNAGA